MTAVRRARQGTTTAPANADASVARLAANPVLGLQRKIGNRATDQLLARARATKDEGMVHIGKLPAIKILGGNAGDWAAKKDPYTLEIISKKGKHSSALERLSRGKNKVPLLKVITPAVNQSGQHLDFGTVEIELGRVRIADYAVDGNVETWRAVEFETAHRNTITHMTGV
jgi:hypothetical protein